MMERAKVIIHMYVSIDGTIDGPYDGLETTKVSGDFYDRQIFQMSDANANGATTVAMYAATGHPDLSQYDSSDLGYQDWVPDGLKSDTWDVSFDRHGRCGWTRNYFDYGGHKSHAIEVVTRQTPLAYLAFLQSMKIPYIVCGDQDIDLEQALVKLKRYFGIATLAVCGGGIINGAFLKAGLVDQISLVMAPYVSGDPKKKRAFNTFGQFVDQQFSIQNVEKLSDGGVHLLFQRVD